MSATLARVNRALTRSEIPLELERDPSGYHYFIFDDRGPNYETESVMIPYTSHITVERWLEYAALALEAIRQRIAARQTA